MNTQLGQLSRRPQHLARRHRLGLRCGRLLTMCGMSLVEVMVWLAVLGVGSTMILHDRVQTLRDQRGQRIATSMAPYTQAIYDYVQKYRDLLVNAQPVAGVANPLAPTISELQTLGIFPATYPQTIPTNGGTPLYAVARIPTGCVGNLCDLGFQFTNSLPELNSDGLAAEGVLGYAARQIGATAGYSSNESPGTIEFRGGFTLPNPQGAVAGIISTFSTWSASGVSNFVKIGDTRDPNLQGPLTAAGAATLNGGATVNGGDLNVPTNNLNVNCFKVIGSTGKIGTNCLDPNDQPTGWGGGVRTLDVVATGGLMSWNSAKPLSQAGTDGWSPSVGQASGLDYTMINKGTVRSTGQLTADRVTPFGLYTPGTACADSGAIAQSKASPGYVGCINGTWVDLMTYGTEGAACSQSGAFMKASDGSQLVCVGGGTGAMKLVRFDTMIHGGSIGQDCSGVPLGTTAYDVGANASSAGGYPTLICRQNPNGGSPRYLRLHDLVTNISFAGAAEVTHGGVVAKPSCPVANASQTALAIPQMLGKSWSTSDGGTNIYAVDNGVSWTAILTNGAGATLSGNPNARAVMEMYCYYP